MNLNLSQVLQIETHKVITAIGGGGKTSTLLTLAKELKTQQKNFFITTTTRMAAGELAAFPIIYAQGFAELSEKIRLLSANPCAIALATELTDANKVIGLPPEWIDELKRLYPEHFFLIEGDGAQRKPFKAPDDHEPVIPRSTDLVVGIIGSEVIEQTLSEKLVHRAELVSKLTKVPLGAPLDCLAITEVITNEHGYRKNLPKHSDFAVVINKADLDRNYEKGKKLASLLLQKGISPIVLTALQTAEPVREVFYT